MKVYLKRDGSEVQGATNLKTFNDLNGLRGVEYLHIEHMLRTLTMQNVVTLMKGIHERLAAQGEVYIMDLDAQPLCGQVRYEQTTLENLNAALFQPGNASILSLYWIKAIMEQMGFEIKMCGLSGNDFWLRATRA